MSDTSAICTIGTFLSHVEDTEIRSALEFAMQLSQAHVQKLQSIFTEEQHPIPEGFSVNTNVNKEAPRLFTDDFYLSYIQNIGKCFASIRKQGFFLIEVTLQFSLRKFFYLIRLRCLGLSILKFLLFTSLNSDSIRSLFKFFSTAFL